MTRLTWMSEQDGGSVPAGVSSPSQRHDIDARANNPYDQQDSTRVQLQAFTTLLGVPLIPSPSFSSFSLLLGDANSNLRVFAHLCPTRVSRLEPARRCRRFHWAISCSPWIFHYSTKSPSTLLYRPENPRLQRQMLSVRSLVTGAPS